MKPEKLIGVAMRNSLLSKSSGGDVGGLIRQRSMPNAWFRVAAEKLRQIACLPANWDSYGSRRPDSIALNYAGALLNLLCDRVGVEAPCISPHPNGNISFEWDNDERTLTVEIDAGGRCHYYYECGEVEEQRVSKDFNYILHLVTKL